MKKNTILLMLVLLVFSIPAGAWTGNVNAFLGRKTLDKHDWEPADKQGEFGILIDFRQDDWPVSIAIDLLGSADEVTVHDTVVGSFTLKASTGEFDVGARKIWETAGSSVRPYFGGGIAFVSAEWKETTYTNITFDDNGTGIWLNGGLYWTLGLNFNLGLDIRYTKAEVSLLGYDVEAGGTHAGVILGYHW